MSVFHTVLPTVLPTSSPSPEGRVRGARPGAVGTRARRILLAGMLPLLLTACGSTSRVAAGRLTPVRVRITDEAIARDLATMDALGARLHRASADTTGYLASRALAYLALAREAYERNDQSSFADDALQWAASDVEALERGGPVAAGAAAPVPAAHRTAAPELWARADSLRQAGGAGPGAGRLAIAEAWLIRAAHAFLAGPACVSDAPVAAAQAILAQLTATRPLLVPDRPAPVPVDDAPLPVRPRGCAGAEELRGVPGTVHFALDRHDLASATREVLDRAASVLAPLSGVRVRLTGHTDVRASDGYNQALAERRVRAVRDYLVSRGVVVERLEFTALGEAQPLAAGASARDHARNRRVELRYVLCDGTELPPLEALSDLQLEAARRRLPPREKD
jgi:outer membrane protein OmpA-like peptidoglycan-associated protein